MIKPSKVISIEIVGASREPQYRADADMGGRIHTLIVVPDHPNIDLTFTTPEAGYDFAQAIMRAYDRAIGIA